MAFDDKRGVPPIRRAASQPSPFGHTTLRFFSEGEKHEASQWQDVPDTVEDELRARRLRVGDFDRIPRQRGATLALAVASALLALGAVLGVKAMAKTGRRVDASAVELQKSASQERHSVAPAFDAGAPNVGASASSAQP